MNISGCEPFDNVSPLLDDDIAKAVEELCVGVHVINLSACP